ncbi:hypothetical protein CK203_073944 [Vitis vinifera]|uniref:Uncharacterized protein n=1 Tax=Vitis vinifera TaxID=29760 RepID=A0A438DQ53_VITVI|nr:hypothetical protein CK203_073944 [Vitis vinifera]
MWSPRFGCSAEGEDRKEAWVRILGLPISLWVPSILRRVGEECSGFLGIDPLTEGGLGMGKDPGKAEWRGLAEFDGDQGGGGEGRSRVVMTHARRMACGEKPGAGPKEQRRSEDVTGEQVGGEGGGEFENWAHLGRVTRQSSGFAGDGSSSPGSGFGPVGLKRDSGQLHKARIFLRGLNWLQLG